jgi:hypothetical protein
MVCLFSLSPFSLPLFFCLDPFFVSTPNPPSPAARPIRPPVSHLPHSAVAQMLAQAGATVNLGVRQHAAFILDLMEQTPHAVRPLAQDAAAAQPPPAPHCLAPGSPDSCASPPPAQPSPGTAHAAEAAGRLLLVVEKDVRGAGFGFSLAADTKTPGPVYVSAVSAHSPAATLRLAAGARIVEINGTATELCTMSGALELIQSSPNTVWTEWPGGAVPGGFSFCGAR